MFGWLRAAAARLHQESLPGFRLAHPFLGEKLQCYDAPKARVLYFIDNSHSPTAYRFKDSIFSGDRRSRLQFGVLTFGQARGRPAAAAAKAGIIRDLSLARRAFHRDLRFASTQSAKSVSVPSVGDILPQISALQARFCERGLAPFRSDCFHTYLV
jgi:hypothetical protein